jgi:hypothetical protein
MGLMRHNLCSDGEDGGQPLSRDKVMSESASPGGGSFHIRRLWVNRSPAIPCLMHNSGEAESWMAQEEQAPQWRTDTLSDR